ncbi:SWIB/MDM2 domain protein [Catovirus CTV1]|uniref:SWIB/MDM2 domain protein n=1 Tax=Catovirus CTV1 TaxID=1977631 RepID=A0A1V0SBT1_9VIRU|nr:SWIB/MDM2 domain protein [Catovirus CTV1]
MSKNIIIMNYTETNKTLCDSIKYNSQFKSFRDCLIICERINDFINDGNVPNDDLIYSFIDYVCRDYSNNKGLRYYSNQFIQSYITTKEVSEAVKKSLESMSIYFDLSKKKIEDMVYGLMQKYGMTFLVKIFWEQKREINREIFHSVILNGHFDCFKKILEYFPNLPNSESIMKAIKSGSNDMLYDLLNMKIECNENTFEELLKKNSGKSLEIFKQLLLNGLKMSVRLLEIACSYCDKNIIHFILSNKILPTEKCFINILKSRSQDSLIFGRNRKKTNNPNPLKTELIEVLVLYGFKLTYENLLLATQHHVYINNIEQFDIKFDEKFLEKCSEFSFYPNYNIKNLKPNVVCLENECLKMGNIKTITKIVESGITPTTKALQNACTFTKNNVVIKYLIDKGAKVDIKCIKNCSDKINNVTLSCIVNEYEKQLNKSSDNNINNPTKINDLEDSEEFEYSEESDNLDSSSDNQYDSPLDENIPIISEHDDDVLDDDHSDTVTSEDNSDDNSDILSDPEEESPVKSKKIIVKGKPAKNEEIAKKEEIVKIASISVPKNKVDQRTKIKISDKISKFIGLKSDETISFIDLRKKLLEYFNKNSLYYENDKMLIRIDKKLSELLNLEENNYLRFDDLDNLVYQIMEKN